MVRTNRPNDIHLHAAKGAFNGTVTVVARMSLICIFSFRIQQYEKLRT